MSEPTLFPLPETPAQVRILKRLRLDYEMAVLGFCDEVQGGCKAGDDGDFCHDPIEEIKAHLLGTPVNPHGFKLADELLEGGEEDGWPKSELAKMKSALDCAKRAYKTLNEAERERAKI